MRLRRPSPDDLTDLHRLQADPDVWQHYPSLRATAIVQTQVLLDSWISHWEQVDLGTWIVTTDDDEFIGYGGPTVIREGRVWNIGYRIRPAFWGAGIGTQVARRAIAAAQARDDRPVIAFLLEHNTASRITAERAGLQQVWRGPDAFNPDPDAVRLVFADRLLDQETLRIIVES